MKQLTDKSEANLDWKVSMMTVLAAGRLSDVHMICLAIPTTRTAAARSSLPYDERLGADLQQPQHCPQRHTLPAGRTPALPRFRIQYVNDVKYIFNYFLLINVKGELSNGAVWPNADTVT